MSSTEFDIIRRYFSDQQTRRADVSLGIGDDAALLLPPSGQSLVVSVDTLVSGVHFPNNTSPDAIGHKALAVNLSDLAAMGAVPAWFTLALTLPDADENWLAQFSQGLFSLAREHNIQLVGGDTTRGPLSITIQVMGFVPEGEALTRSGAQVGDAIYVTGTLGDAGAGLQIQQGRLSAPESIVNELVGRLDQPTPKIAVGTALRGLASATIDISDGLNADLGHVLTASNVGADVEVEQLPMSDAFKCLDLKAAWHLAASAGDDYELCFTVPSSNEKEVQQKLSALGHLFTKIGNISAQPGLLRWVDSEGNELSWASTGYDHFANPESKQ
jgi:thiamine-monophosphate kinase